MKGHEIGVPPLQDVPLEPECQAADLGGVQGGEAQQEPHRVPGEGQVPIQGAQRSHQRGDPVAPAAGHHHPHREGVPGIPRNFALLAEQQSLVWVL